MKHRIENSRNVISGSMKKPERFTFIIAVVIIAAVTSCVKDLTGGKEKSSGDEMALVTLSLTTPATRAMTEAQENAVTSIDVLLFTTGDDNLYYRTAGTSISDLTTSAKQFNVRLPVGTYNVVVLANATALLSGIAPSTLFGGNPPATTATGASRATVLEGLVVNTITDGKIPMWGYKNGLVINETTPSPAATIDLTRAIARVDVSLDGAVDNFKLKNVYLYNRYSAGSVAPAASSASGNVDGYDGTQWKEVAGEKIAIAPNIPSTAIGIEGPVAYTVLATQERAFTHSIYAFETPAGNPVTGSNWETNTCLVIGGTYTDADDNDIETYYRVEFRSGDGNIIPYIYLALLRNHLYDVVIQEVSAPGWPTVGDAYKNLPSNIVVQITEWNDGGMSEVLFDGQHSLTVDRSLLEFYKEGYAKSMTVSTTYPDGWTAEDLPAWLIPATATSGAADATATLTFTAVPGDLPRSGEFYIVAGNLRKKITVALRDEVEFWISITDLAGNPITELFFEAGSASVAPVARSFRVTWLPTSISAIAISEVPGTNPFAYESGSYDFGANTAAPANPAGSGAVEFTVQPPYNASSNILATRIDFTASLLDGQSRMLPLYLRQDYATYAFSTDGKTLTLFENFPRGWLFNSVNDTNIPELADSGTRLKVETLVIEGDFVTEQIWGIKDRQSTLPHLQNVSLPHYARTIPGDHYSPGVGVFSGTTWLKRFEAPLVTAIGVYAFSGCSNLTHVIAPKVTVVEDYTYYGCGSLTSVDYLPKVTRVGQEAFYGCSSLYQVDLSSALTIGIYAFYGCSSLTYVNTPKVTVVEEGTYYGCSSLACPDNFSNNVTRVGAYAFCYTGLPYISFVIAETIEQNAFEGCTNASFIGLWWGTRTIGDEAFRDCTGISGSYATLGYPGAIDMGIDVFSGVPTSNVDLYLDPSQIPGGNDWGGYTWKSINPD